MKPALMFVVTFVVAMGASTGAKVAMTKPGSMKPAHDSTHVAGDSTKTDSTAAGTPEGAAAPSDTARGGSPAAAHASAPDATKPDSIVNLAAAAHGPEPTVAAKAAGGAPVRSDTASERRIAKVFTSMDAKQAAKVLEHMADSDVEIILGYVGPRQAASILAALPPERVATLSKIAMQGKSK
jgi:hypothetical protein